MHRISSYLGSGGRYSAFALGAILLGVGFPLFVYLVLVAKSVALEAFTVTSPFFIFGLLAWSVFVFFKYKFWNVRYDNSGVRCTKGLSSIIFPHSSLVAVSDGRTYVPLLDNLDRFDIYLRLEFQDGFEIRFFPRWNSKKLRAFLKSVPSEKMGEFTFFPITDYLR